MKRKNIFLFLICAIGTVYNWMSCVEDPDMSTDVRNAAPPQVRLLTGTSAEYKLKRSATSVTIQAEVVSSNGLPVEQYGVCWSLDSNATLEAGDTAVAGKGLGEYVATACNLKANQTYHIRPFAMNKKGISYGEELNVTTTSGLGIVQTLQPGNIRAVSVSLGGKVLDAGEGEIKEKGVYVATSEMDPSPRKVAIASIGEDSSFVQTVGSLKPETKYYAWAYMTNPFGTVKGEVQSFVTPSGKPVFSSIAMVAKDYTSVTVQAILRTTGDSEITESGFCYSSTQPVPSLDDDASVTTIVPCEITNDSVMYQVLGHLNQQTTYYVRAYAANSFGTVYSGDGESAIKVIVRSQAPTVTTSEIKANDVLDGVLRVSGAILDRGETDIVDAGFCWSESESPTVEELNYLSTYNEKDTVIRGIIEGLRGGTTYYVAAYAKNTKAISYGEVRKVRTPDVVATLPNYIGESVTEASFCVLNGIGYVFGGDLGGERSSQLVSYDIRANSWSMKTPAKEKVKGAAFVPLNPFSILSLGGRTDDDKVSNAFSYYSVGRNEWILLDPKQESPALYGASGLALDNVAYYFGGSSADTMNMRVFRFYGNQQVWDTLKTEFPEQQMNSVAVMMGSKAYVGLGLTGNHLTGVSYSKSLWSSSDFLHWEEQSACPTTAQGILRGVLCSNKLYALDTDFTMWAFDPVNNVWSKQLTSFGSLLSTGSFNNMFMFAIDGIIYMGLTNGSKKFIKYDPAWDH